MPTAATVRDVAMSGMNGDTRPDGAGARNDYEDEFDGEVDDEALLAIETMTDVQGTIGTT